MRLQLKGAFQLSVHKYEAIIAQSTFIPVSLCNHGDTAPRPERRRRTLVCEPPRTAVLDVKDGTGRASVNPPRAAVLDVKDGAERASVNRLALQFWT